MINDLYYMALSVATLKLLQLSGYHTELEHKRKDLISSEDYEEQIIDHLFWMDRMIETEYMEYYGYDKHYFSDPRMYDFFLLCRQHAALCGQHYVTDPYFQWGLQTMRELLPDISYIIYTQLEHFCATGILFVIDETVTQDSLYYLFRALVLIPKLLGEKSVQLRKLNDEIFEQYKQSEE